MNPNRLRSFLFFRFELLFFFFDDRFFAVNDFEVATWKREETQPEVTDSAGEASASSATPRSEFVLGALLSVPVKGARDIAKVQRNRFAVAGSFGRALYRYLPEGDKLGDTFYWSRRLPGRLEVSVTDRRRCKRRCDRVLRSRASCVNSSLIVCSASPHRRHAIALQGVGILRDVPEGPVLVFCTPL